MGKIQVSVCILEFQDQLTSNAIYHSQTKKEK